jgi:peptide subunit release factor 1 (eRF1)
MISYEELRQLQQYLSESGSMVLSLYVDVDQSKAANLNHGFQTAVENLLRQIAEREAASSDRFQVERERVLRFLKDYTPRGKGLVIFSDSSRDFWWQRELQVSIPTEARWSPQPWLRPLLDLVEEQDLLGIVLIDKARARIMTLDSSGLKQQAEMASDTPSKHHTTGTDHIWSQSHMERDHQKHIKWHAKRVADELNSIVDRHRIAKLVIGGSVEATSVFAECLPKRLQQMIIGTVSVPVDAGRDRLERELRDLQQRAEQEDELKLVRSLVTAARKSDRAVTGLSETVAMVNQGRIYKLVVSRDFRAHGKQCSSCRALFAEHLHKCSFCGGGLEDAPDLVNRASQRVLEQGGRVQMVSGQAASELAQAGHIGATLRF